MPDNTTPQDLIWIVEAARTFERSREWISDRIAEGSIGGYQKPGDKKLYVSEGEMRELTQPRRINQKPEGK